MIILRTITDCRHQIHRGLLVFSFVFVFLAVSPSLEQKPRRPPNRPPSIESFTSSSTTIQICRFFPSSAVSDKPEVTLSVNATDPDGDSLYYEYSSAEGTISGEGRSVLWHLDGLPRGRMKFKSRSATEREEKRAAP